jgi:hypothetical protein
LKEKNLAVVTSVKNSKLLMVKLSEMMITSLTQLFGNLLV